MTRPPLVIYSPLPPSRSGIADYCYEQLKALARDWEITVVIDDHAPVPEPVADVRIQRQGEARDTESLRLYHTGNNLHHEHVYYEALRHPGVTVLHDYLLHHLSASLSLARDDKAAYRNWMAYDHGALGQKMADQRDRYLFSEYQQFLLPLNGQILDNSLGVIVHSRSSLDRIRASRPHLLSARIPHHYSPPARPKVDSRSLARQRLGLPQERFILCSLGSSRRPSRSPLSWTHWLAPPRVSPLLTTGLLPDPRARRQHSGGGLQTHPPRPALSPGYLWTRAERVAIVWPASGASGCLTLRASRQP